AFVAHWDVQAILKKGYVDLPWDKVVWMLDNIKKKFTISAGQEFPTLTSPIQFWIENFDVSSDEREQGYRGHFARTVVTDKGRGLYDLALEKVQVPLNQHPQKKRPKQRHPDWGHPALRTALNQVYPSDKTPRRYTTAETARRELQFLARDY